VLLARLHTRPAGRNFAEEIFKAKLEFLPSRRYNILVELSPAAEPHALT
jgi:hypothetical protein